MAHEPFDVCKALLERRDNYVRHTFTLLVSWFTFFITVNWASLGWLTTVYQKDKTIFGELSYIALCFLCTADSGY